MCRIKTKDTLIDNSYIMCLAKTEKLPEIEEFISNPNSADILKIGDRCYNEKMYLAAQILFVSIKNNSKISSCLVRLKEYQKAIEFAKKANTPKSWKEVCIACVES